MKVYAKPNKVIYKIRNFTFNDKSKWKKPKAAWSPLSKKSVNYNNCNRSKFHLQVIFIDLLTGKNLLSTSYILSKLQAKYQKNLCYILFD